MEGELTDEEFWSELGDVYIDAERLDITLFYLMLQKRPGRHLLMTEEERAALASLPAQLTIYRGYSQPRRRTGCSWTVSRERGEWFARRFAMLGGTPRLLTGTCAKSDVVAHFTRGQEAEIIVDPKHVRVLRTEVLA